MGGVFYAEAAVRNKRGQGRGAVARGQDGGSSCPTSIFSQKEESW